MFEPGFEDTQSLLSMLDQLPPAEPAQTDDADELADPAAQFGDLEGSDGAAGQDLEGPLGLDWQAADDLEPDGGTGMLGGPGTDGIGGPLLSVARPAELAEGWRWLDPDRRDLAVPVDAEQDEGTGAAGRDWRAAAGGGFAVDVISGDITVMVGTGDVTAHLLLDLNGWVYHRGRLLHDHQVSSGPPWPDEVMIEIDNDGVMHVEGLLPRTRPRGLSQAEERWLTSDAPRLGLRDFLGWLVHHRVLEGPLPGLESTGSGWQLVPGAQDGRGRAWRWAGEHPTATLPPDLELHVVLDASRGLESFFRSVTWLMRRLWPGSQRSYLTGQRLERWTRREIPRYRGTGRDFGFSSLTSAELEGELREHL